MNLIKSFNFKYLKENIKKSKGLIVLSSILVPIFTLLITVLYLNNEIYKQLITMGEIIWINMIGLFVIPVAISMALFGYIYKKTSVDLVNSMPLNRKTIFVTNTIGGIAIITIIQVITAIILLLCNIFCANMYIFPEMIFDIFVLMWISYVFVFLATNVAMALSGTHLTQIVLTLLILFLVPFCHITLSNWDNNSVEYKLVDDIGEVQIYEYKPTNAVSYTMPSQIFAGLMGNNGFYSTESIIKMVVLGITYYFLGLYLFKKRKMENTEESFADIGIHLLVKALTILPMVILLNMLDPDTTFLIIAFTCIAVYYFVYDFVVKKKVRLKVSFLAMILIFVILQVLSVGMLELEENEAKVHNLYEQDVIAVALDFINSGTKSQYFMGNRDIISYIYEIKSTANQYYYSTYATSTVTSVDVGTLENENVEPKYNVNVSFKDKNGDIYNFRVYINGEQRNKLISMVENDENYLTEIKKDYMENGKFTMSRHMIDDNTTKLLNTEIETRLNTISLKELISLTQDAGNSNAVLDKYYYKNHQLLSKEIPIHFSNEILKLVAESQNQFTKKIFEKRNEDPIKDWVEYDIVGGDGNKATSLDNYRFYNIYYAKDELDKYVSDNLDKEFDPSKEYYIFRIGSRVYSSCYFFTNDVEKIEEFITKEESFQDPEIKFYDYKY